jgi:hypothetical protein
VAIYHIEPALARRDLNMLLVPVLLLDFLSAAAYRGLGLGQGLFYIRSQ